MCVCVCRGLLSICNRQKNTRKTAGHIDPLIVYCAYVHTRQEPAKSCKMTVIKKGRFSLSA